MAALGTSRWNQTLDLSRAVLSRWHKALRAAGLPERAAHSGVHQKLNGGLGQRLRELGVPIREARD